MIKVVDPLHIAQPIHQLVVAGVIPVDAARRPVAA
jgi:hypothetical protein